LIPAPALSLRRPRSAPRGLHWAVTICEARVRVPVHICQTNILGYSKGMTIVLILLAGALALEVCAYILKGWNVVRKTVAALSAVLGGFATGMLFMTRPNLFSGLIVVLGLYRIFNMVRIVEARMHERYLRRATWRSGVILLGLQIAVAAGWLAWNTWHTTGSTTWQVVTSLQAVVALLLCLSVLRNLKRTLWPQPKNAYSDRELPTLSVAIPARNETEDLQICLETIIASDYPKLEIIVLDDCSQLKRTPEIIKNFAHAGVRFVQGEPPKDIWLPKNQAYDHLAREASGEYMLFCGADIRFAPNSLRSIMTTMLDRKKKMLSVLPLRQKEAYGRFSLIQAMRYYWELVPPRRYFKRPPVISSCWVIEANALKKTGGFPSVARAIVPEAPFAKALIASDGYSFLRSNNALGVTSNKTPADQRDTAVRMRYPQLHRRPEQVAIVSLLELYFLCLPFMLAITGGWLHIGWLAQVFAGIASVLLVVTYELAARSTQVNAWWFALVAQPFAVLSDIFLLHYSMWKYEFSVIEWKGRNVCIPVMHVVPHLPYTGFDKK